jgi:uncharacterized protein (AIM24 family)
VILQSNIKALQAGYNYADTTETFTTRFKVEGLFFATLKGPGKVWIQTLPISRLASRVLSYGTTHRKEEGSILGGLGNMLDGDGY